MHSHQAGCNQPRAGVKYVISPIAPEPCSLEVRLLGPFKLAVDGLPVEEHQWPRRKPKLLIKLLALQPHHRLHREQIMELLWPELEPESAVNNLRKTVHLARRALEPALHSAAASHFLLTQNQQIIPRAPRELRVDVDASERRAADAFGHADANLYEAALALYEGDLLTEDLYEDWAAARRESLRVTRQKRARCLRRRAHSNGRAHARRRPDGSL